ncbi:MAG: hypothetical protein NT062_07120 [Proteobacteria bacterium]|nr:hypothetical protein [Pseudomonadota bacterium]
MPRQHTASQISQALLAIGALLVGGLAVYLFVEVRTTPAVASVTKDPVQAPEAGEPPPPVAPVTAEAKWTAKPATPTIDVGKVEPSRRANQVDVAAIAAPTLDGSDVPRADPKGDAILDEVNRAYDHGEYDDAKTSAMKVLAKDPNNIRMLRVAVSSSCILGDNADAQRFYDKLPQRDRDQMKTRCKRYEITFSDGVSPPP